MYFPPGRNRPESDRNIPHAIDTLCRRALDKSVVRVVVQRGDFHNRAIELHDFDKSPGSYGRNAPDRYVSNLRDHASDFWKTTDGRDSREHLECHGTRLGRRIAGNIACDPFKVIRCFGRPRKRVTEVCPPDLALLNYHSLGK